MATAIFPAPFDEGFRLIAGGKLNSVISAGVVSSQDGITAFAGGGLTGAIPMVAVNSRVTTVASPNDSVKLMAAVPGTTVIIDNDGANTLAVFPAGTDQIEDATSAISVLAGQDVTITCPAAGKWYIIGTSGAFSGAFNGTVGATTPSTGSFTTLAVTTNSGTFTANGTTPVVVAATGITANSVVVIGLKTVGGTPAAVFFSAANVVATSFTVNSAAANTSVYNWAIIN